MPNSYKAALYKATNFLQDNEFHFALAKVSKEKDRISPTGASLYHHLSKEEHK